MPEKKESKIFLIYCNNDEIYNKKVITKYFNKNHKYIFLTKNRILKKKYANIQEYTIEDNVYLNTDILKSIAFEVAVLNFYKKIIITSFLKFLNTGKKKNFLYKNEFEVEDLYTNNQNNCKHYFLNLKKKKVNKKIKLNNITNIVFIILDTLINKFFIRNITATINIHYFIFNLKSLEKKKFYFSLK